MGSKANKRNFHNDSGFSLIEVLAALGVLALLLFIISSVFINMNNQNTGIQLKVEYASLEKQIAQSFRNNSSCKNNLINNGINFPGGNFNLTRLQTYDENNVATGTIIPALNAPVSPGSRLRVTSMRLADIRTLTANKEYSATLLAITLHNLSTTPQFFPILVMGIRVSLDNSGNISACTSEIRLSCVTGFLNAQTLAGSLSNNSNPGLVTTFASVFTIINSPPKWGLQCNSTPQRPWIVTNCSTTGLLSASGSEDSQHIIGDPIATNSCIADVSSIPGTAQIGQGLYLTCCLSR